MNTHPARISAIIPTRNRSSLLAEAIDCVLDQTVPVAELIVVDDGSTDTTGALCASFGKQVRYLHQAARGPAAARNLGLRAAAGDFVAFLDDDDLWLRDKNERQLPCLLQDPGIGMVLGHTQRMVKRASPDGDETFVPYRKPVRLFSLGCGLYRRQLFDSVGFFDEHLRFGEDDDWFLRAAELGVASVFLPDVSQLYRFHDGNMTRDKPSNRQYLLRLARNRLDRARAGPVPK